MSDDRRVCIEDGCENLAPQHKKAGRRCHRCRRKHRIRTGNAVTCRKCREPTKFVNNGLCERCTNRKRVRNLPVGRCCNCDRDRKIIAAGRCNSCYQAHRRRQRPKAECSACGKSKHLHSSGVCYPCNSKARRKAKEAQRAREAMFEDGRAVTVRITKGDLTLWMSVDMERNSDLNTLVDVVPRATKMLIGKCQMRLAQRGTRET